MKLLAMTAAFTPLLIAPTLEVLAYLVLAYLYLLRLNWFHVRPLKIITRVHCIAHACMHAHMHTHTHTCTCKWVYSPMNRSVVARGLHKNILGWLPTLIYYFILFSV